MSDKTYSIKMYCGNCKEKNLVEFARGTLVEDSDEECPTCGCKGELARVIEPVVDPIPVQRYPYIPQPYWWYGRDPYSGQAGVTYSISTSNTSMEPIENSSIGRISQRMA